MCPWLSGESPRWAITGGRWTRGSWAAAGSGLCSRGCCRVCVPRGWFPGWTGCALAPGAASIIPVPAAVGLKHTDVYTHVAVQPTDTGRWCEEEGSRGVMLLRPCAHFVGGDFCPSSLPEHRTGGDAAGTWHGPSRLSVLVLICPLRGSPWILAVRSRPEPRRWWGTEPHVRPPPCTWASVCGTWLAHTVCHLIVPGEQRRAALPPGSLLLQDQLGSLSLELL